MSKPFSTPPPVPQPGYDPRVIQPLDPGRMPIAPPSTPAPGSGR